jgi:hypothetical protein
LGAAAAAAATSAAGRAHAQGGELIPAEVQADSVSLDAKTQAVEVKGNVRVDASPFHLRSERLLLRRSWRGLELEGPGRLAFCPCLGTPLTVSFDGAAVAPPGDLLLKDATLQVYRVPIFWLPVFWLRSPARVGVLPPDVAYRGVDGMYAGGGVHVPLRPGDPLHAVDLRAGAYFKGGAVGDVRIRTDASTTRVRLDHLDESGLTIDARGSFEKKELGAAWDVDAIRGARGVLATTDLEAAARRWDRAGAEAAVRADGWLFSTAFRSVARRGGSLSDLGAYGPVLTLRRSGGAGNVATYDVTVDGGQLRAEGLGSTSFARGELGAAVASTIGPLGVEARGGAAGALAADGARSGADGDAWARVNLGLPLGRAYESSEPNDPWLHRLEPRIGGGAVALRRDAVLDASPARGMSAFGGSAWVADAGLATALGRWGRRDGLELEGALGAAGDADRARPLVRWRAAASGRVLAASGEGANVLSDGAGHALVARARLGPASGLHLIAVAAGREGVDPAAARALTDPSVEVPAGLLAAEGWTGGARLVVPWWSLVVTGVGVDADLTRPQLVGARAGVEIRDRCRCLVVRTSASHRIGRDGVDVWATIDLAP